jgi:hypothetical protein
MQQLQLQVQSSDADGSCNNSRIAQHAVRHGVLNREAYKLQLQNMQLTLPRCSAVAERATPSSGGSRTDARHCGRVPMQQQ